MYRSALPQHQHGITIEFNVSHFQLVGDQSRVLPPQERGRACQQFIDREWLGNIVIGAHLQTADLIHLCRYAR